MLFSAYFCTKSGFTSRNSHVPMTCLYAAVCEFSIKSFVVFLFFITFADTKRKTGMSIQLRTIVTPNATAAVCCFSAHSEVSEYHAMIRVTDPCLSFPQQLEAVMGAYSALLKELPPMLQCSPDQGCGTNVQAVFKRYFLSDATNQADDVVLADVTDCAKSIIEQPPLDGTKVALWVWLMSGVHTSVCKSGLYEAVHGAYRHLWNGSAHNLAANSEYQMRLLFNEYVMQLAEDGCTLRDNCLRTWLFVNDIDLNYGGVVRARNQVFFTQTCSRRWTTTPLAALSPSK